MSDFDLDRLGDVWRQQPDPAEMQRLQRTAIAVARRARLAAIVDICAAVAVAAVVIILVLANPKPQTIAMGSAAILLLLGSNIRLRKLRQVELKGLTGTTEDMLDQAITRVETTLRHHKFTLYLTPPTFLFTILGFAAAFGPPQSSILGRLADLPGYRPMLQGFAFAALVGLAIYLIVSIRRGRHELDRLNMMRDAYRDERDSSAP
jgi:membrane protein implicated in regulation of membrane protease activity